MTSLFSIGNEAHLTMVSLIAHEQEVRAAERVLNAEELARANRFVHADVRRRFVICRSRLRHLLAGELRIDPAEVQFRYERWGKPRVVEPTVVRLHFNVSHSGEWGVILLAQFPVGVDLEMLHDRIHYRAIASQILSSRERVAWERLTPAAQSLATIRLWVCKEALLKAMGLGIAEGLQQISFQIPLPNNDEQFSPETIDGALQMHLEDDGTCSLNHWIDSRTWRLQLLDLLPNSQAAVCLPARTQLVIDTVVD